MATCYKRFTYYADVACLFIYPKVGGGGGRESSKLITVDIHAESVPVAMKEAVPAIRDVVHCRIDPSNEEHLQLHEQGCGYCREESAGALPPIVTAANLPDAHVLSGARKL